MFQKLHYCTLSSFLLCLFRMDAALNYCEPCLHHFKLPMQTQMWLLGTYFHPSCHTPPLLPPSFLLICTSLFPTAPLQCWCYSVPLGNVDTGRENRIWAPDYLPTYTSTFRMQSNIKSFSLLDVFFFLTTLKRISNHFHFLCAPFIHFNFKL